MSYEEINLIKTAEKWKHLELSPLKSQIHIFKVQIFKAAALQAHEYFWQRSSLDILSSVLSMPRSLVLTEWDIYFMFKSSRDSQNMHVSACLVRRTCSQSYTLIYIKYLLEQGPEPMCSSPTWLPNPIDRRILLIHSFCLAWWIFHSIFQSGITSRKKLKEYVSKSTQ